MSMDHLSFYLFLSDRPENKNNLAIAAVNREALLTIGRIY
jgi:hypothetical protein